VRTITTQPIIRSQAVIESTSTKGRTKDKPTPKERTTTTLSERKGLAYEWFLELPVRVVVLVLWIGGVAFLGALALVAYALISALVGVIAGAF
jgi:hypothetical protein